MISFFNNIPLTPEDRSKIDLAPIFPKNRQILVWFLNGMGLDSKQAAIIDKDPECQIVMQNILKDRYPEAIAILNKNKRKKTTEYLTNKKFFMAYYTIIILFFIIAITQIVHIAIKAPQTISAPKKQ